ncbi:hypothetical protein GGR50DRAFT_14527 [Xylaria sp. CBS 124048]|nr:hypothetical protein GGR50DRAFT_14527 [Xylaria sp. CBS 124048]
MIGTGIRRIGRTTRRTLPICRALQDISQRRVNISTKVFPSPPSRHLTGTPPPRMSRRLSLLRDFKCSRDDISIEFPPSSTADDAAFVDSLVGTINAEYGRSEVGVVRDGTQRTTVADVAGFLRARHLLVAFFTSPGRPGRREPVGCIVARQMSATHGAMSMLAVRAEHHGTGIARDLFRFGEAYCRRAFDARCMQIELLLPTRTESAHKTRLQAWYERMGYAVVAKGDFAADYPDWVPLLLGPADYRIFEKSLVDPTRDTRSGDQGETDV